MLVGRSSERVTLDQLLEMVRAGGGQALLLCGEPGIGKVAKTNLRELALE